MKYPKRPRPDKNKHVHPGVIPHPSEFEILREELSNNIKCQIFLHEFPTHCINILGAPTNYESIVKCNRFLRMFIKLFHNPYSQESE